MKLTTSDGGYCGLMQYMRSLLKWKHVRQQFLACWLKFYFGLRATWPDFFFLLFLFGLSLTTTEGDSCRSMQDLRSGWRGSTSSNSFWHSEPLFISRSLVTGWYGRPLCFLLFSYGGWLTTPEGNSCNLMQYLGSLLKCKSFQQQFFWILNWFFFRCPLPPLDRASPYRFLFFLTYALG